MTACYLWNRRLVQARDQQRTTIRGAATRARATLGFARRSSPEELFRGFKIRGRLVLTKAKRQYDDLARELDLRKTHLGSDFAMLPRAALRDEIASDLYCGGAQLDRRAD